MKTTLTILLGLSMSLFANAQTSKNVMTVEMAIAIKHIVFKINQGETLTEEETNTYNTFRQEGKKSAGGSGGMMQGQGMQGQGMKGQGMKGQGMKGQGMKGQGMQGQGMQGPSEVNLKKILIGADKDGDGKLDPSEFEAACEALRPKN